MNKKIQERIITPADTIITALKKMDAIYQKLLIILENEKFIGLLSIGDIQRAIIRNVTLNTPVVRIIRSNPRIATTETDFTVIKNQMLEFRMELMPIVDGNNNLIQVYFWEDIFAVELPVQIAPLNLPVVIMAGGKGERLQPITNVIPKPLIPLNDKPIIEDIIKSFCEIGSADFIISVNYKSELIKFYFDQIIDKDYKIKYIKEERPLGTIGSLYLLKNEIKSTFFLTNCDILIKQDYREIYDYHLGNKNEITLVSSVHSYSIPYGTLSVGDQGKLLDINEKPDISFFINTGFCVLEPHLLKEIPPNNYYNMTDLIESIRNRDGSIGVFPISKGSMIDIGNLHDYLHLIDNPKK